MTLLELIDLVMTVLSFLLTSHAIGHPPFHTASGISSPSFGCCGTDFGSPSRGVLGISDGNDGVQWNAGYRPDGFVWPGVNLEGMQ